MGYTTLADGLRKIYSLTAHNTRKIAQIQNHPQVSWFFANDDASVFDPGEGDDHEPRVLFEEPRVGEAEPVEAARVRHNVACLLAIQGRLSDAKRRFRSLRTRS